MKYICEGGRTLIRTQEKDCHIRILMALDSHGYTHNSWPIVTPRKVRKKGTTMIKGYSSRTHLATLTRVHAVMES